MSARRVAVEIYLGYKEEISQKVLEHKIFEFKERRTHRLHLQDDYEESVGPFLLWVMMMDKYVAQHLKMLLYSITQHLSLLCYCIEMNCPTQLTLNFEHCPFIRFAFFEASLLKQWAVIHI
jgi:hypothetical protein